LVDNLKEFLEVILDVGEADVVAAILLLIILAAGGLVLIVQWILAHGIVLLWIGAAFGMAIKVLVDKLWRAIRGRCT
jgi:hypothetical protein